MDKRRKIIIASVLCLTAIGSGSAAYLSGEAGAQLAFHADGPMVPVTSPGLLELFEFAFYASTAVFVMQILGLAALLWRVKPTRAA